MKKMLLNILSTSEKLEIVCHQAFLKYMDGKVLMRAMRVTTMLMAFTLAGGFMASCADGRDKLPDILYGDELRVWYVDFDNDDRNLMREIDFFRFCSDRNSSFTV